MEENGFSEKCMKAQHVETDKTDKSRSMRPHIGHYSELFMLYAKFKIYRTNFIYTLKNLKNLC